MKLFWITFILNTGHVFCNHIHSQSHRDDIKKTFGYDCEVKPKIGEILFWKISNCQNVDRPSRFWKIFTTRTHFKPQKFIRGITQLQSNETYLILSKTEKSSVQIFSWMGSQASLDDKKVAVKYMIQHYWEITSYHDLKFGTSSSTMSREREAKESELFQHIIISPKRKSTKLYGYYKQTGILLMYPNLYIVRGVGDSTCMKKVPMGTLWLKNDTCLVLETGYNLGGSLKVYIHCGIMASVETCNRTSSFASQLRLQYGRYLSKILLILDIKNRYHLKPLIELLENINYHRMYYDDNSNEHLMDSETFVKECDERISLSIITSDSNSITDNRPYIILEDGILKQDITERPIFSNNNRLLQENLIFNTDSISGVFVRFGSFKVAEAVITMQYAEQYVHNIESDTSIPTLLQIEGGNFPNSYINTIDLKIHFIDYPPVR